MWDNGPTVRESWCKEYNSDNGTVVYRNTKTGGVTTFVPDEFEVATSNVWGWTRHW